MLCVFDDHHDILCYISISISILAPSAQTN
jgi:hypothetical protein